MVLNTDVLVIGGGGAGARAAIEAAANGAKVILSSKGPLARCGITPLAQRSIEAAMGNVDERDYPEEHFEDILREGRWLSDQDLAEALAQDSPQRIFDLQKYGTKFRKQADGSFYQFATPGQTYPRSIVPERGGYGIMLGLRKECLKRNNIELYEDTIITKVISDGSEVSGAVMLDLKTGELKIVETSAIIIATGGNEELWPLSDCPPESVGEGMFMALEAGAYLVDMEQLLYYPQVVCSPHSVKGTIVPYEYTLEPKFCGGELFNGRGENFLPKGPLPARDEMIRLIFNEIRQGRGTKENGVLLDVAASGKSYDELYKLLNNLIPEVYEYLKNSGIDLAKDQVQVAPAAHYTLGGVWIDRFARTNIKGLWAAGEVAANIQGANRSSGNALAETQVFGARAGKDAAIYVFNSSKKSIDQVKVQKEIKELSIMLDEKENQIRPHEIKAEIKKIMGECCGFPRNGKDLQKGIEKIEEIINRKISLLTAPNIKTYNREWLEAIEVRSMASVAKTVLYSALMRSESRGHHFREDFPNIDNEGWLRHTLIHLDKQSFKVSTSSVRVTRKQLPVAERSPGKW